MHFLFNLFFRVLVFMFCQTASYFILYSLISFEGNRGLVSANTLFQVILDAIIFQELRGYMLKYGGRLENYFSRHRVTHIICSNLPDSKIKNLRFNLAICKEFHVKLIFWFFFCWLKFVCH